MSDSDTGQLILRLLDLLFRLYWLAILARVVAAWLPMAGVQVDSQHPVMRFLHAITDPLLNPLRRFASFGMLDLSPVVALILLELARQLLDGLLRVTV